MMDGYLFLLGGSAFAGGFFSGILALMWARRRVEGRDEVMAARAPMLLAARERMEGARFVSAYRDAEGCITISCDRRGKGGR